MHSNGEKKELFFVRKRREMGISFLGRRGDFSLGRKTGREKKSSHATFLFWVEMTEGQFLFLEDEGRLSAVPAVVLGKSYPYFDRIVRKKKKKLTKSLGSIPPRPDIADRSLLEKKTVGLNFEDRAFIS